ncbi:MAG TPA: hypothetical protein EYQ50_27765 [Verrucomicrobiales bacterium]|nr:hypothetical protein [Verrucomicrobiales bacterium]HIL69668.1 hypothetical protein [Verrucomicrobiota bacterium]
MDTDVIRHQMFLVGDRDIVDPRFGLPNKVSSIVNLGTNHSQQVGASWSGENHRDGGNVALGDGSVQGLTTSMLREQMMKTEDVTNRLGFP